MPIVLLIFSIVRISLADFVYYDFNATTGLVLNGNAGTSSCIHIARNEYSNASGIHDIRNETLEVIQHQKGTLVGFEISETEDFVSDSFPAGDSTEFGHRESFKTIQDAQCAVRLRLTGSKPRQISSVWYAEPLPVLKGFETRFTFQITDQSKHCIEVKDENFGTKHYRSCSVHGGDGFAFVIHANSNKTETVRTHGGTKNDGSQMGFENIANSLAIEFDTWTNGEHLDTFNDHIAVYSNGVERNSVQETARLSRTAMQYIADGKIHVVKIRYYNELKIEYFEYFSATPNLHKFISDVSEGRRVGTLLIFADDGIQEDKPLIAIPINLAATLRLPLDRAYVGFTASTGKAWQKHDILGWYYCTLPPCLDDYGRSIEFEFDYNKQSMLSQESHGQSVYPNFVYPDVKPWTKRQTYFAENQKIGVGTYDDV